MNQKTLSNPTASQSANYQNELMEQLADFFEAAATDASLRTFPELIEHNTTILPRERALEESCELSPFSFLLCMSALAWEINPRAAQALRSLGIHNGVRYDIIAHLCNVSSVEAIAPDGAIRRFGLLHCSQNDSWHNAPLRLTERVLLYLLGNDALDDSLLPWVIGPVSPVHAAGALKSRVEGISKWFTAAWDQPLHVRVAHAEDPLAVISAAAHAHQFELAQLHPSLAKREHEQVCILCKHLTRESRLRRIRFYLDLRSFSDSALINSILSAATAHTQNALIIATNEHVSLTVSEGKQVTYGSLSSSERIMLIDSWYRVNPLSSPLPQETIDAVGSNYRLTTRQILNLCGTNAPPNLSAEQLVRSVVDQSPPRSAVRVEPRAAFDDLIVPEATREALRALISQLRHRQQVYSQWGFAAQSDRGLAISALFSGQSGTGKTFAAEAIARELSLELFIVDLSATVSKYIGETEQNLSEIFTAAEASGAVLLFDEADSLFSKRNQVKSSNDRYANIEVAYLLQRMERFNGMCLLTTNFKESIDSAFFRRLRFSLTFPFPDRAARSQIWQRVFPADAPRAELSFDKLAQLNCTGGTIRSIALQAAFFAAEKQYPIIDMKDILRAAKLEYLKMEKPLTDAEIKGWTV